MARAMSLAEIVVPDFCEREQPARAQASTVSRVRRRGRIGLPDLQGSYRSYVESRLLQSDATIGVRWTALETPALKGFQAPWLARPIGTHRSATYTPIGPTIETGWIQEAFQS